MNRYETYLFYITLLFNYCNFKLCYILFVRVHAFLLQPSMNLVYRGLDQRPVMITEQRVSCQGFQHTHLERAVKRVNSETGIMSTRLLVRPEFVGDYARKNHGLQCSINSINHKHVDWNIGDVVLKHQLIYRFKLTGS